MNLFEKLFHKKEKHTESVVLIDVAADSVAGAYVRYVEDEMPVMIFSTRRLPVEIRRNEPLECAMLRALETLGNELIREGAPALLRATGSGRAETILLSFDTPWQGVNTRTEHFERKEPFIFTKSIVATALEKTSVIPEGKVLVDESIISAILNGYETHNPYGKKIRHASLLVLTSFIDTRISESFTSTLRGIFHTKHILPINGNSLRYQAMRTAFPHEREMIIFDAIGPLVSATLVRNNRFVAIAERLNELARHHMLPKTVFVLAREADISSAKEKLGGANHNVVPVIVSHISNLVRQTTTTPLDLQLLLMALYYQRRLF